MTELKVNLETLQDDIQNEFRKLHEQGMIKNLDDAAAFKLGIDTALSLFGVSKRSEPFKCEAEILVGDIPCKKQCEICWKIHVRDV